MTKRKVFNLILFLVFGLSLFCIPKLTQAITAKGTWTGTDPVINLTGTVEMTFPAEGGAVTGGKYSGTGDKYDIKFDGTFSGQFTGGWQGTFSGSFAGTFHQCVPIPTQGTQCFDGPMQSSWSGSIDKEKGAVVSNFDNTTEGGSGSKIIAEFSKEEFSSELGENAEDGLDREEETTTEEPFIPYGAEIVIKECIDAPELCQLPKEIRDRIIDWFYEVKMEELDGNFLHTFTYKDAKGDWHINWGSPWGWTQRVVINTYKGFAQTKVQDGDKFFDFNKDKWWGKALDLAQTPVAYVWKVLTNANLDANPNIPKKSGMGTCGDVMAYINKSFREDFPGLEITTLSMAWDGLVMPQDHAANIVMPINPKTGKQYKQNEVPQAIFTAKTGANLPKEWQNTMVLDGWAKRVVSFKDWFNEYKHGDGEVGVGD